MTSPDTPDTGAGTPPDDPDYPEYHEALHGPTVRPATDPAGLVPARLWQLALAKSIEGLVVGDAWEAAAAIKGRLDSRGVVLAVDPTERDALAARLSVADGPGPEERPEPSCATCGHGQGCHSSFGMCDGAGTECYCVRFPDAPDFAALPVHREEPSR